MFHVSYEKIKQYMRRGRWNLFFSSLMFEWNEKIEKLSNFLSRAECNSGSGLHPLYVNVEMGTGNTATNWIDSLQAAFPGVQVHLEKLNLIPAITLQVLHGDLEEAICHHALYYSIWKKYGCLPER